MKTGGGGVSLNMVSIHVLKNDERGDFCHRLVGSRDPQKWGIFAKKGRCLTELTVTPIKGVLW